MKREDFGATWAVLPHPRDTFRQLRARKPVLAPWIVGSLLAVGLTALTLSVSQRAAVHLAAELDAPELAQEMQQGLRRLGWVSVAGAPAGLIARWALVALVLWAPASLATARAGYRGVLSVVAYSAMPGLFGKAVDLGVAWTQGPELGPDLVPVMSSATSLGAFFPAVQGAWPAALLDHLTVFGIWGLVLWILGLSTTLEISGKRAAWVAVPVWTLLLVLAAAMDVVGRSMTAGSLTG
ncbi:MAG TPA: Yip1 family protein [bacterium]|nr:Yip1 family protein [bacterium]